MTTPATTTTEPRKVAFPVTMAAGPTGVVYTLSSAAEKKLTGAVDVLAVIGQLPGGVGECAKILKLKLAAFTDALAMGGMPVEEKDGE